MQETGHGVSMSIARVALGMILLGLMGAGIVAAQGFPNKPIRILTSAPGGSSDFVARSLAQGLSAALGQPVIVENRAGGVAIAEPVSKAAADGHTLLIDGATLWLPPLLQSMPYDPVRDFAPITLAAISPNILVVHPSLPVKSVKELIALARARPGELSYGSAPPGASTHLAMELFNSTVGIKTVRISYKGAGPAVIALIGGEVQLMIPSASAVMGHVKSGRLKALAVTSSQPSGLAPGLPTVAESGLPGYEATQRTGLFAPARTPAPIVSRLNHEAVGFLMKPETKERFLKGGVEAAGSSAEELGAAVKADMAKWGKVIIDAGIRGE